LSLPSQHLQRPCSISQSPFLALLSSMAWWSLNLPPRCCCNSTPLLFLFLLLTLNHNTHQHHPHNTINMHQPSLQSSDSSPASRLSRAMHFLTVVGICCAFGKSLHFTYSHVHSCLPLHAGSFDASAPQGCSCTLADSSTWQGALVAVNPETRRSRAIASPGLIGGDDDHQPLCQSHGTTSLLCSI
jgi:hypothetical protein